MAYGKFDTPDISRENAMRGSIHGQVHPLVAKTSAVIGDQSDLALHFATIESGQQPQVNQHLKAIAYPDHNSAVVHKCCNLGLEAVLQAHCHDYACAMVVTPGKSSAYHKNLDRNSVISRRK